MGRSGSLLSNWCALQVRLPSLRVMQQHCLYVHVKLGSAQIGACGESSMESWNTSTRYVSFNWTFKDTSRNSIKGSGELVDAVDQQQCEKWTQQVVPGLRGWEGGTPAVWGPDVRKRRYIAHQGSRDQRLPGQRIFWGELARTELSEPAKRPALSDLR